MSSELKCWRMVRNDVELCASRVICSWWRDCSVYHYRIPSFVSPKKTINYLHFFSHFSGKEELNPWDWLFMKEKFLLLRNRNGNLGSGQTFLLPCLWHHFRIHLHPVLLTELRPFHDDLVKLLHLGSSVHTPVRDNRVNKESWVRENGIPEMIFRIRRVSAFGTF